MSTQETGPQQPQEPQSSGVRVTFAAQPTILGEEQASPGTTSPALPQEVTPSQMFPQPVNVSPVLPPETGTTAAPQSIVNWPYPTTTGGSVVVSQQELDALRSRIDQLSQGLATAGVVPPVTQTTTATTATTATTTGTTTTERPKIILENPIRPVTQELSTAPFVLLPTMPGIAVPYKEDPNTGRQEFVAALSLRWLEELDAMRAAGWPYYDKDYSLEVFLLRTAFAVKQSGLNVGLVQIQPPNPQDANYTTPNNWSFIPELSDGAPQYPGVGIVSWEQFGEDFEAFKRAMLSRAFRYVNSVEQFALCYPDQSRQEERLRKGYEALEKDIENSLGKTAFLPQNWESNVPELMQCPPLPANLYLRNVPVQDFLRNFTQLDPSKPIMVPTGAGVKQVPRCVPPPSEPFAFIPKEFRQQIEEAYNIVQFRYSTEAYKRFMYTLANLGETVEGKNVPAATDDQGRQFIVSVDDQGNSYRLYLGTLNLTCPVHEFRLGVPEGQLTLREWWQDWSKNPEYYPLIHAILNAPAPSRGDPNYDTYRLAGYIYVVENLGLRRMYADAPLVAFKKQLVSSILRPKPGETFIDCFERFVRGLYSRIYAVWAPKIPSFPQIVPTEYRERLAELWNYGESEPEFCTSLTQFGTGPSLGTLATPSVSPLAPTIVPSARVIGRTTGGSSLDSLIRDFNNIALSLTRAETQ